MKLPNLQYTNRFFNWKLILLLAFYAITFQVIIDFSYWLQNNEALFSFKNLLSKFLINFPNLLFICYLDYRLIQKLDIHFSWNNYSSMIKRFFIEFFLGIIIIIVWVVLINLIIYLYKGQEIIPFKKIFYSSIIGVIINILLILTMEFYFQYTRHYETALDNAWLKKENSHFQYEILKNQLNPHFLFNSLNTLSALVSFDGNKAKEFTRKLSNVYRHVLEQHNKELITLEEEINFLKDYIFLLKTRFESNLQISVQIKDVHLTKKIIPMALQILIENAVKHNSITDSKPLKINIISDANSITVHNIIQHKKSEASWGIGLKNIRMQYAKFNQEVNVIVTPNDFKVILPLL